MKKIAFLTAVIMSLLVFSCVFATEEENLLIAPAPETTGENINEEEDGSVTTLDEPDTMINETGIDDETVEDLADVPTDTEETQTTDSTVTVDDSSTEEPKSNSTIIGAIIAIVIVVVVVALAALVQKK